MSGKNFEEVGKTSDNTASKMKKLGDTQKTGTSTQDKLSHSSKNTTSSFKDLTVGVSNVTTAGLGFYNTYDRVSDMTLQVDKANLKAKQSANSLEDANRRQSTAANALETAQKNLSDKIEKYGYDSDEAAKATENVNQKLSAYEAAQDDASLATERADLAAQAAKQTQDNYNDAIASAVVSILPQAITLADGLSKTYSSYKNIDFSGIINKFTGKGGLTDSLGVAGGATDILKTKIVALNGISLGGLLGALGAVAVALASISATVSGIQGVNEGKTTTGISPNLTPNIQIPGASKQNNDVWGQIQKWWDGVTNRFNYVSSNPIPHFASGFEGVTKGPTLFLAGEAGQEEVNITPMSGSRGVSGLSDGDRPVQVYVDSHPAITIESLNGSQNPYELVEMLRKAIETADGDRLVTSFSRALRRNGKAM